jgi:hypothetical protein
MTEHRKLERAAEDFILQADEMTLQRFEALIKIRKGQISSFMLDKESQQAEGSKLQSWQGRTW